MYVRHNKGTKRLTIELPIDQYEFLRKHADKEGTTVSGLIRKLIEDRRSHASESIRKNYKNDAFFRRRGSFDGPSDLAEHHDSYLYGEDSE